LDDRHVRKKRVYKIPTEWLKLTPEKAAADKAVQEQLFQPALDRFVELTKADSVDAIPQPIQRRLKGIINKTVEKAVNKKVFADLNDPRVREMVINESLKYLVWIWQGVEKRHTQFVTPDISDAEFEQEFKAEQERMAEKNREEVLRAEEDRKEKLYHDREQYAKENVMDEASEVSPEEMERAKKTPLEQSDEDLRHQGLDPALKKALKIREERRRLILSRLEEDDVPEWLKHAVDTEDTEYFPSASGRFQHKQREDVLAEFFKKELDDCAYGSEKETKLMEFIDKFVEDEESGAVQPEPVEDIKKRVHAMLKKIEDRERTP
jgi:hypothetical protein